MPGVNSAAAPAPAKRHPHRRRFAAFVLLALRHSSGWILRIFFTLLVLAIGLFAYLHLVGLPAYFTDRFLDWMAAQGYFLQIERLTLEMDRGLVARQVRLFAAADAPTPFMEAEALSLIANPWPWLRNRPITPHLSIVNGALRVRLGREWMAGGQGTRVVAVDRLNLRFMAGPDEVRLREFAADFLNIHFEGRGAAYLAPPARAAPPANPITAAIQALETAPDWILRIVDQVGEIAFNQPPSAHFTFALYAAHPEVNAISLHLDNPAGGSFRGVAFDQFQTEIAWQNQQVHLAMAQIRKGAGLCSLSGWLDLTNQTVSARLLNTVPPAPFLELLPAGIRQQAAAVSTNFQFPLRLDLKVGPCPWAQAAEHVAGSLAFSQANLRDVPIENLSATFARAGPETRLENAAVQLGSGPHASRFTIRAGSFNLDTRQFVAQVAGTLNPHLLKPLMTPNMRAIVEWFGIQEPIAADVVLGGEVGNPAIYCYGPVQATNFAINGIANQSLQARLNITNEVMHLTEARFVRPEGSARGECHMAFSNQTLRLEADSTLDPRAIAGMVGPEVAAFFAPFRFNGPTRLQVAGLLDYCNFALNRLEARVDARGFGYDRWEADQASFDLSVRGRRLNFSNAVAAAYGGQLTNLAARLYPVGGDANWRYEVSLAATNLSLTNLIFATTGQPPGDLRGTLDGALKIAGLIGAGAGPSVTGSGQVGIRNGLLFQTRLFSGLSAILAKVLPDFTLFAQTDATGTFRLRNSRLLSRDIELSGTLFSAKAKGDYAFSGDLAFDLEIQLLRGGPVAALVRFATAPVTRLLKARLTGTFAEPRWGLINPMEKLTGKAPPDS